VPRSPRVTRGSRAVHRTWLVAALALPAVLLASQAAFAATWTWQNTPQPGNETDWELTGASCLTGGWCVSVGDSTDQQGNTHVMAEERQGPTGAWTLTSPAEFQGTIRSEFTGVSCVSTTSCVAVGNQINSNGEFPLSEGWDGSGYWFIDVFPTPSGAQDASLSGVSCPTASTCVAVGTYSLSGDGSGPTALAALRQNGSWTLLTPATPSGAVQTEFSGVWCTSATHCIAVGNYSTGNGPLPLAEVWNGSTWAVPSVPAEPSGAELTGVSCTAATACTAVGPGAGAIRWNGSAWSQQTLAKPSRGTVPDLFRVSCPSATTCTGVGEYFVEGIAYPAAEVWNGTAWKYSAVTIDTSFDTAYLNDVSCFYPDACTAVGTYQDPVDGYRSVAETVTVTWQLQTTPAPSEAVSSAISGVSCVSSTTCLAVAGGSPEGAYSLLWNGAAWTDGTIPSASVTDLNSVSCSSGKACTAVGGNTAGGGVLPLADRWNGTAWSTQSVPLPSGRTAGLLTSVSCVSATSCVTVGNATSSASQAEPFASVWNGATWATTALSGTIYPHAVSCTSASACTVVGDSSSGALAQRWNGHAWTVQHPAAPSGGTAVRLNGVSCRPATACLAVGSYTSGGHQVTLSEFWSAAGGWTVHATPPLSAATASELLSVSCSASGACTAVGDTTKSGHTEASLLAEQWDGTKWGVMSTATPPGSGSVLKGVSCLSGVNCTAGGFSNQAHLTALAEQYS